MYFSVTEFLAQDVGTGIHDALSQLLAAVDLDQLTAVGTKQVDGDKKGMLLGWRHGSKARWTIDFFQLSLRLRSFLFTRGKYI
ncbi:hypothetical protein DTO006G1_9615 [Penicillium roqueforti]|nr:hypothetical protein CBS147337_7064 [Penicillium roqueforti]KAI2713744.1 hypothetical protein CBS147318_7022 [Penicillium roqueforti]KAI2751622.1 hypothetical protein DTO006G1_9615 [Penicillium roqueforti]KAI3115865.1 hypothetical protein CBS147330_9694 [Penicillium roqueforti]KAI3250981.1 hypothetical protein DTO006G7_8006 [Penicillium roqueforti]